VLRLTDFKTNELKHLQGGVAFEVEEENPMLGLRGAARYMQDPEVFALELEAIRQVRKTYKNLWVMVPFVRTVDELKWVISFMREHGLERGPDFRLWMMAEVPSNVLLLEEFVAAGLDGVSIGSNDLTQLILGIDRDNERLRNIGDERNPAVLQAIEKIVTTGRALGITVGICGQAPSDHPEITDMLVGWGATSISVSPDKIAHTREIVASAEARQRPSLFSG
jgi:pyruvate,water dikinase